MSVLNGARVVLYVTGGIAAYKVSDLASKLTQAGTEVDVVRSRASEDFVGLLTCQALTRRTVYRADDAMTTDSEIAHVRPEIVELLERRGSVRVREVGHERGVRAEVGVDAD